MYDCPPCLIVRHPSGHGGVRRPNMINHGRLDPARHIARRPDYTTSFQAFFKGLGELRLEGKEMPRARDEFIPTASPFLRSYVEHFASSIPISTDSEFAQEWREEGLNCIVLLCAYERWARHEHLRQTAR